MHEEFGEQTYNSTFGRRVRAARERREWSQRRLAEALEHIGVKLDPSAVTRIERGTREVKLREAVALAIALKIPLHDLAMPPATSPRDQLEGHLDSVQERATIARHAFGGMAVYYAMAVHLIEENPELLQQFSLGDNVDAFLKAEATLAESSEPVVTVYLRDAQLQLIEEIIRAQVSNLVTVDAVDDDDDQPET